MLTVNWADTPATKRAAEITEKMIDFIARATKPTGEQEWDRAKCG